MFELKSFLPLGGVDLVQILAPLPGAWVYTVISPEPEFYPSFRNRFLQSDKTTEDYNKEILH